MKLTIGTNLIVGIVVLVVVIAAAVFIPPMLQPRAQPLTPVGTPTPIELASPTPQAPVNQSASLAGEYGVDPILIERNTLLYTALLDAGVPDSFVDITKERVLVRYELPSNYTSKNLAYYVFGLAASMEPYSDKVLIQVMAGSNAVEEWEAGMADLQAFKDGTLSESDFGSRVRHTTI